MQPDRRPIQLENDIYQSCLGGWLSSSECLKKSFETRPSVVVLYCNEVSVNDNENKNIEFPCKQYLEYMRRLFYIA